MRTIDWLQTTTYTQLMYNVCFRAQTYKPTQYIMVHIWIYLHGCTCSHTEVIFFIGLSTGSSHNSITIVHIITLLLTSTCNSSVPVSCSFYGIGTSFDWCSHFPLCCRSGLLCDVTLKVGGVELSAHKNILSSCSQYFYAMFTGDLAESKSDCITLQEIDPKALSLLIDFIYTSEIHVTEENVQVGNLLFACICSMYVWFTNSWDVLLIHVFIITYILAQRERERAVFVYMCVCVCVCVCA